MDTNVTSFTKLIWNGPQDKCKLQSQEPLTQEKSLEDEFPDLTEKKLKVPS